MAELVLEAWVEPQSALENPLKITVLSFVFVTIAVWATQFFQTGFSGILLVTMVSLPSIPLITSLFALEETETEKEIRILHSRTLTRHVNVLLVLVAYFLGLIIGFTFWYLVLPQGIDKTVFSNQIDELKAIRGNFYGYAVKYEFVTSFETVFLRNLQVLAIILAASILYGAGCVFILVWNASIIGVFLGTLAKTYVLPGAAAEAAAAIGLGTGVLGIIPHGSFEMLAYLTGALAGGIFSSAIIRKAYNNPEFIVILYDVAKLVSWAIVLLAIGAFIEGSAMATPAVT